MPVLRFRRLLAGFLVRLVLAGLIGLTFPHAGHATDAADSSPLAGWWIAIDRWWPMIWEGAGISPTEELLIVAADGHVENRLMQFHTPDAKFCVEAGLCSDAPVAAQARIVVADGRIEFIDRVESNALTFFGKLEPSLNSRYPQPCRYRPGILELRAPRGRQGAYASSRRCQVDANIRAYRSG